MALLQVAPAFAPNGHQRALVLVHGHGSTSATNFDFIIELYREFGLGRFDLYCADYETNAGLRELGEALGGSLQTLETRYESVAILGYSMGGLVARMALMLTHLPKTFRLVTLAAPNQGVFGAAHLSRMSIMLANSGMGAQLLRRHARGVDDMRQVHKRFREVREEIGLAELNRRLANKSYINIPANFFHENREERAPSLVMKRASRTLRIVDYVHNVVGGFTGEPGPASTLTPPHDGLVEMRSARMMPTFGGSFSETQTVSPQPAPPDWNLVVMRGVACDDEDHVSVLRSQKVATIAAAALMFKDPIDAIAALHAANIEAWIDP